MWRGLSCVKVAGRRRKSPQKKKKRAQRPTDHRMHLNWFIKAPRSTPLTPSSGRLTPSRSLVTASLQLATGRPYGNPQHTLLFAYWAQLCLHPPTATTEVRHPTYHADTGRDVPPYVLNRRCNYYENFSFPSYSKFSNFFNHACTSHRIDAIFQGMISLLQLRIR